jgi:hypothetical protein
MKSEEVKVSSNNSIDPEIQRLTTENNDRRIRADCWDTWNLKSIALAGFAGLCLLITAIGVSRSSRAYIRSSDELSKAKDARLSLDLNKKDGEIGQLKQETAELTSQNLQLEAVIAPRRLTAKQEQDLASLSIFAKNVVAVKSYASDIEGAILATQIIEAIRKSRIDVQDNRLTMMPAGSVTLGVSISGSSDALVGHLNKILADFTRDASSLAVNRGGVSTAVSFGTMTFSGPPPAATIIVGPKPIKIKK